MKYLFIFFFLHNYKSYVWLYALFCVYEDKIAYDVLL